MPSDSPTLINLTATTFIQKWLNRGYADLKKLQVYYIVAFILAGDNLQIQWTVHSLCQILISIPFYKLAGKMPGSL